MTYSRLIISDNNEPIINEDYEKNISDMQLGLKKLKVHSQRLGENHTENNIETIKNI